MLRHYLKMIDEKKTRTKEFRSTRDTDEDCKPRSLLWLFCSQLVSLTGPANREVNSAERIVPAERFDILKDQNVRSFSVWMSLADPARRTDNPKFQRSGINSKDSKSFWKEKEAEAIEQASAEEKNWKNCQSRKNWWWHDDDWKIEHAKPKDEEANKRETKHKKRIKSEI
jgi:hypothetical protein